MNDQKEIEKPERIRGVFAPNYPRKVLWKGKPENRTTDTIIIKRDEYSQSFVATIPELDGLNAFGDTPEQALAELNIAKRLFLEVMEEGK